MEQNETAGDVIQTFTYLIALLKIGELQSHFVTHSFLVKLKKELDTRRGVCSVRNRPGVALKSIKAGVEQVVTQFDIHPKKNYPSELCSVQIKSHSLMAQYKHYIPEANNTLQAYPLHSAPLFTLLSLSMRPK